MLLHVLPRMDPQRYEITLCSLTTAGPVADNIRAFGFEVIALAARGRADLGALIRLSRELRHRRTDILHSHLFHANMAARLVGKLSRVPVVITDERDVGAWKTRSQLLLERLTVRLCDQVTAVSQAAADWAATRQGVSRSRLRVIRNGVALPPPSADREVLRHRMRAELGLPQETPIVLSVGRIDPMKGYEYLVDAVPAVAEHMPQVHFFVVGGTAEKAAQYRARLLAQAADLGIASLITFGSHRDDVPDLMRAADLLVLSSVTEGLPNVLLEAMAAGLPPVATAVGGCCELDDHGRNLRLVRPRDPAALAEAILALLQDQELSRTMAESARAFVAAHYSWEKTVAELDQLYTDLLARRPRPGLGRSTADQ